MGTLGQTLHCHLANHSSIQLPLLPASDSLVTQTGDPLPRPATRSIFTSRVPVESTRTLYLCMPHALPQLGTPDVLPSCCRDGQGLVHSPVPPARHTSCAAILLQRRPGASLLGIFSLHWLLIMLSSSWWRVSSPPLLLSLFSNKFVLKNSVPLLRMFIQVRIFSIKGSDKWFRK